MCEGIWSRSALDHGCVWAPEPWSRDVHVQARATGFWCEESQEADGCRQQAGQDPPC